MDYDIKISYKDGSGMSRSKMAKWLYDNRGYRQIALLDSLALIDNMIDGMIWAPEYYSLDVQKFQESGFLNVEVTETPNEFELSVKEYSDAETLRQAGLNGCAESAIAFCKLNIPRIYNIGQGYAG